MRSLSRTFAAALVAGFAISGVASAQARRAITVNDLLAMHRVSDPQLSPDGTRVVYTVATPDRSANRNASNLWIVPVSGGASRQLTFTGRDTGARS